MSFEEHHQDKTVYYDFSEQTSSISSDGIQETNQSNQEYDNLIVTHIPNEQLEKQDINKSEQNNKSLSLILSLRINNQFLLQNQTIDEQRYQSNQHQSTSEIPSLQIQTEFDPIKQPLEFISTTDDFSKFDDMPMKETLLEEEHEQNSAKFTDPTSLYDESSTILNLTTDEIITLHKLSEAINKIIQKQIATNEIEDSIPISAKQLEIIERRKKRYKLQREIITIAKKALKPAFKNRHITKEEYKKIMKKVVTKATYSNKVSHKWINKMIDAYVKKYQSVYHHRTEII